MPFNLLTDPFFPAVTSRGQRKWLTFPDLAVIDGDDYAVDFDWPRVDFNIAAFEFAIGVAMLAFQPVKRSVWTRLWTAPPQSDDVRAALAPFVHAFNLDGDGPRFMQEFGGLAGEETPVEALLIDTPGANGQKKNADLLTHRHRYPALGLQAAAMALYALQQFAPSGGAGNRTSMRGGGPLTTLVMPGAQEGARPPLWRVILANLPVHERFEADETDLPKILPWLAPTLVSDKAHGERAVAQTDDDAHPLQAFFGMPRRIALKFAETGVCAMTGDTGPCIEAFVQKPWGANYGLWTHPLTPYRKQKVDSEPYSVKPKSARFGYRDWTPVVIGETKGALADPSEVLAAARRDRPEALRGAGGADAFVRLGGWAMNNMEAIAYLAAEQPLHLARNETAQAALDLTAKRFARSADTVASMLVYALRAALFSEGAKPATDKGVFEEARMAFFEATETDFHAALDDMLDNPEAAGQQEARAWLRIMTRAACKSFDTAAPIQIDDPARAQRIADAFRALRSGLAGYGKSGQGLFAELELPPSQPKATKKGKQNGR